jgi:hypothetical protein
MIRKYILAAVTLVLMPALVNAQPSKTEGLLMAMSANSKQMSVYQWKQKTTIIRKGNPAGVRIDEVRFDASGQPQRITIVEPEEKKMGPLRARKASEIRNSIQEVMQLASRYADPREIGRAIRKGEAWEGQGSLRVAARSVILPADEMEITVNTSTLLPARITFKTQHDGSPISIALDYQQFPSGPNMMTRMTVQIPKEDVVVHVESFDFVRLAAPTSF